MTARYRPGAAARALVLAGAGYLLVLAAGLSIASLLDGDGFAGLGLIATTLLVLAPLGGLAGAAIGLRLFGDPRRPVVTWRSVGLVVGLAVVLLMGPGIPMGVAGLIIGLTINLVYRAGLGPHRSLLTRKPSLI